MWEGGICQFPIILNINWLSTVGERKNQCVCEAKNQYEWKWEIHIRCRYIVYDCVTKVKARDSHGLLNELSPV